MEPMDLDPDEYFRYRSNTPASPCDSPPHSPVGNDSATYLSENEIRPTSLPLFRQSSATPISHHRPGSSLQQQSSMINSSGIDSVNDSLNDILSLNRTEGCSSSRLSDIFQSKYNSSSRLMQTDQRNKTAPPWMKSNTNDKQSIDGNNDLPRRVLTAKRSHEQLSEKIKSKTGYGLVDDNELFSHYPSTPNMTDEKIKTNSVRNRPAVKSRVDDVNLSENVNNSTPNNDANFKDISSSNKTGGMSAYKSRLKKLLFLVIFLCIVPYVMKESFMIWFLKSCHQMPEFNEKLLTVNLKSDMFGQHIASQLIQFHMKSYFNGINKPDNIRYESETTSSSNGVDDPCRPLILSFHGHTGVGKNFGSHIISKSFSEVKLNLMVIPVLFPHPSDQDLYGKQIQEWIVTNIKDFVINLFVIDEMDKSFPAIQKGLSDAVDWIKKEKCSALNPIIIILISNTHALDINQRFIEFYFNNQKTTRKRIDLKKEDFYPIFHDHKREQWYTNLTRAGHIDAFVPFLPLEKVHVVDCIKRELTMRHLSTSGTIVDKVLKELSFSSVSGLELSSTGCKRVAEKLDFVIYNYHELNE